MQVCVWALCVFSVFYLFTFIQGDGVYLNGAKQTKGQIVCFYPGTMYLPAEPILFVSLGNQYILKCVDGLYVDGKVSGLSGKVYKSLFKRENWPGAIQISDWTWLKRDNLAYVAVYIITRMKRSHSFLSCLGTL